MNIGLLNMQTDDDGRSRRPTTSPWRACGATSRAARTSARSSSAGRRPASGAGHDDHNHAFAADGRLGHRPHGAHLRLRRAHGDARGVRQPARVSAWRAQRNAAADARPRRTRRPDATSIPRSASSAARAGSARSKAQAFSRLRPTSAARSSRRSGRTSTYRALLESRRLPGDRLLAHRQPLGAEERLGVPHGHERHA